MHFPQGLFNQKIVSPESLLCLLTRHCLNNAVSNIVHPDSGHIMHGVSRGANFSPLISTLVKRSVV